MEDIKEFIEEPLPEVIAVERSNACDKHEWVLAYPDPNSELVGLMCHKCATGILVAQENVEQHLRA